MAYRLIGIGEILWDVLPGGRKLGGAPANFAYHAHALGARATMASRIGDDEPGRAILSALQSLGLSAELIQTDAVHPTGTVAVEVDREGKPSYQIREDVAWDCLQSDPPLVEAARTADAVCFGTLAQRCAESRRTILTVLSAAPAGALKVLDINLRQNFFSAPLIENSLKGANVLKLNDEELTRLAPLLGLRGSETEMLQQLTVRYPLSCIALTKGARGSVLYSGTGERVERPARRVTVQDTVGAGDAYAAALTLGLLRRHSFTHILEDAHALAEYVCTRSGATPPIPAELRSRFAA